MKSPVITVNMSYAAYASLQDFGYCTLMSENDLIAETTKIGDKVNGVCETGDKCTIRLIARQQEVGMDRFANIYAVAI